MREKERKERFVKFRKIRNIKDLMKFIIFGAIFFFFLNVKKIIGFWGFEFGPSGILWGLSVIQYNRSVSAFTKPTLDFLFFCILLMNY